MGKIISIKSSYLDVKTSAYMCIGIPFIFAALVALLPESPYQLIKDNKYDKARESIMWFRRKPNIEDDFQSMKKDVERQISESGTWKDLLTIKSNVKALRAGAFLRFSQQMCGISVFATYSQPIFAEAGGNISPQISSMIFSFLVALMNLICCTAVERYGRKPTYFYSLLSCGLVLILMSLYFCLDQYQLVNLEKINWFPLMGMIFFVITHAFGLGIVPTLILGEIFSASIKFKGLCVLTFVWAMGIFITSNLFHILNANVGLYAPFLLFGISCLLSTILTLQWVPETKGKTLEEIQQTLKKYMNCFI